MIGARATDWIEWKVGSVVRRLLSRRPEVDWYQALDRIIRDLDTLNRSTEKDFLAVGQKLMEFRAAARQMSSGMAELSELISGQASREACQSLGSVVERARELDARLEESGVALESVKQLSGQVKRAFSGLPHTVLVFRTLCTLTRIETARLGGAGVDFGNLAEEVQPLSERIQSNGHGVLEAAAWLDQGVQSALERSADLRATELKQLHEIIDRALDNLKSFEEHQERAREASLQQSAQYKEVCQAIDDLVQSVQFHDITRQQVEHVLEALANLRSRHNGGRGSGAPNDTSAVLTLQGSQLAGAAHVFASSVERIENALANISLRVREMADSIRALMGASGDDRNAFFLEMETSFTSILNTGISCRNAEEEIGATTARLNETIGRMRTSVTEILGTEIQIQRIAINATIRATQLEATGDALGVVASVMQRLAVDSNTSSEDVVKALDSMRRVAHNVAGAEHPAAVDVLSRLRASIQNLHSSSEQSFRRVEQIAALGSNLAEDISALRGGFSAGRLFAGVAGRALKELEHLGADAVRQFGTVAAASDSALENLASQYTMQRERDIHQAVAEGRALTPPPAPAAADSAGMGDDVFGDNIELF